MVQVFVTGGGGMLGQALAAAAGRAAGAEGSAGGVEVVAWSRAECDVLDADAVRRRLAAAGPGGAPVVIVNCAALTDVDGCERAPERAFAVNATGAEIVARACAAAGVRLIHLSTDYVLDGTKAGAYVEEDAPRPLSVYGASKLRGEEAVRAVHAGALVVRTSWLYGPGGRKNFVETMLRLARERDRIEVVDDQRGAPTHAPDLAQVLLALAAGPVTGVLHAANAGSTTWYGFACRILARAGLRTPVVPIPSERLGRPARRPANSLLDCARLAALGIRLRPWEEALDDYLARRRVE